MIPRICNCPGGGHGTLQISGNYVVPEPKVEDLNGVKVGDYTVIGNSDMSTALPLDATVQIKNVGASIARKGCQTILDTISLNVPVANSNVTQNSTSGLFKATFWNGQLNVKKQ